MHLSIRPAAPEEAGLVADLSRQTFYDTFAAQNTKEDMALFLDRQFTREALMAELGQPGNTFLLAWHGDEVAGYVRLREGPAPEGVGTAPALEIARLYAATHMVGKGVGQALMQASIEQARGKGAKALWLGVWEKNDRAIRFYRQWGFTRFAEHPFVLGNDVQTDWLMKKEL